MRLNTVWAALLGAVTSSVGGSTAQAPTTGTLPAASFVNTGEPNTVPRPATAQLSPVQARVMTGVATRAAAASESATGRVLTALDDPTFRTLLKRVLPAAYSTVDPSLPAVELLERFRLEVAAAEAVHAFQTTPFTTQMSIQWGLDATAPWSLWQFQLAAAARGDGAAATAVADAEGFGAMNAAEEGLFGYPTFTGVRQGDPEWPARVWPGSMEEAADRPIYSTLNLRKIDGGNDIFGPVGLVWRQTTMRDRLILTPVDTGCFEYWCNSTWADIGCRHLTPDSCARAWSGKQCAWDASSATCVSANQVNAANCSQWPRPTTASLMPFAGTLAHFDHLILPSAMWWNGSVPTTWQQNLVGLFSRMFLAWPHSVNQSGSGWSGSDFTPSNSIENFWEAEAVGARFGANRTDGDVKMVFGIFGVLFGTPEGALLRSWCVQRGWALVWALGEAGAGGNGTAPNRTNGVAVYPMSQRFLDPVATGGAGHNLSLPLQKAQTAANATWRSLQPGPARTMDAVVAAWVGLRGKLQALQIEPLYGLSCADLDCIGVAAISRDCVCYPAAQAHPL